MKFMRTAQNARGKITKAVMFNQNLKLAQLQRKLKITEINGHMFGELRETDRQTDCHSQL